MYIIVLQIHTLKNIPGTSSFNFQGHDIKVLDHGDHVCDISWKSSKSAASYLCPANVFTDRDNHTWR